MFIGLRLPNVRRQVVVEGRHLARRVKRHWWSYILQGGLTAVALLVVMLTVDVVVHVAIVVALASSAFIVFVMPHSRASSARRVIGGHVIAVAVSIPLGVAHVAPVFEGVFLDSHVLGDVVAAMAVGLSIVLMMVTKTEHPPAAGTALGIMVGGGSVSTVSAVLVGAVVLSVIHVLIRRRLRNLF